ncbi:15055_t:CDS:2, partial [Funneliformis geosporum]
MTPINFYKLLSLIKTYPIFNTNNNKQQADISLQLAVFLHRLASKGDIFTICALFGIAEGTVILYIKRVLIAILSFKLNFVKWPMYTIDGTHIILINKPPKDPE